MSEVVHKLHEQQDRTRVIRRALCAAHVLQAAVCNDDDNAVTCPACIGLMRTAVVRALEKPEAASGVGGGGSGGGAGVSGSGGAGGSGVVKLWSFE